MLNMDLIWRRYCTYHLHNLFYCWLDFSFQKRCGVQDKHYGITKIEIDFSRALLTSLVRLFVGKPLSAYLNVFWEHGTRSDRDEHVATFPIHICR